MKIISLNFYSQNQAGQNYTARCQNQPVFQGHHLARKIVIDSLLEPSARKALSKGAMPVLERLLTYHRITFRRIHGGALKIKKRQHAEAQRVVDGLNAFNDNLRLFSFALVKN